MGIFGKWCLQCSDLCRPSCSLLLSAGIPHLTPWQPPLCLWSLSICLVIALGRKTCCSFSGFKRHGAVNAKYFSKSLSPTPYSSSSKSIKRWCSHGSFSKGLSGSRGKKQQQIRQNKNQHQWLLFQEGAFRSPSPAVGMLCSHLSSCLWLSFCTTSPCSQHGKPTRWEHPSLCLVGCLFGHVPSIHILPWWCARIELSPGAAALRVAPK